MRLWSLHPRYLDRQALVACWREALLAQAVLLGRTRGYAHHPQLERFRAVDEPVAAVGEYLASLAIEAEARDYRFDRSRIDCYGHAPMPVTAGQLAFEARHLAGKLRVRSPEWPLPPEAPDPHPIFAVRAGPVEPWERGAM